MSASSGRPRRPADQEGAALIFALFAGIILAGLGVVFLATAVNETRLTGAARDIEIALHVSEAAADKVLARVNREENFVTTYSGGNLPPLDDGTLADEESTEDWVEAMADLLVTDGVDPLVTGGTGEAYGIRPVDGAGVARDMVFGISAVPSFDDPKHIRIVKLQFDRQFFQPTHGLLTCGDLDIGGSGTLSGSLGSVHANGDVVVSGTGHSISQELTAGGIVDGAANAGTVDFPVPDEFCPDITPADFYNRAQPPYTCYSPGTMGCTQSNGTDGKAILWWDLCPDGKARQAIVGGTPCTGTVVFDQSQGGANNHLGWKYSTPGGGPTWEVTNIQSGVFYVYRATASVRGNGSGTVTILVEEDTPGGTGNIAFRGSSTIDPALEGLLFVADRDVESNGSASGGGLNAEGLVAAGEQVKLDGNASFTGAIYARDDPHTLGSPVVKSTVSGNFSLTYNNQLDVPVVGIVRVTAWNEL